MYTCQLADSDLLLADNVFIGIKSVQLESAKAVLSPGKTLSL
jgi:hypothetical protein